MIKEEFRVIPGYDAYSVSGAGVIRSDVRDIILQQYLFNGYYIVDTFRGARTKTLPVHRAVALAWVDNPDPSRFTIVNHKDGDPENNWWENLEWTDYSGNNQHAVDNGLRSDNLHCKVRDFQTKEIVVFASVAQAAEFMGLTRDAPLAMLRPKMFGRLVRERYEFRHLNDPTPWFYEHRQERISPTRFMVMVTKPDGVIEEIYSTRKLLQDYQLYQSPYGKSIPALARYGNEKYPDLTFEVRDSYTEVQSVIRKTTAPVIRQALKAVRGDQVLHFTSLTQCAKLFKVDKKTVAVNAASGKAIDGWIFTLLSPAQVTEQ